MSVLIKKYEHALKKKRSSFLKALSQVLEKTDKPVPYTTVFRTKSNFAKNRSCSKKNPHLIRSFAVWSLEEVDALGQSIKAKKSVEVIAKIHKRSVVAIQAQAKKSFNIFL